MSFRKPKPAPEDPAATRARNVQLTQLADLDEEENRRIKQLFSSARGSRVFRGLQKINGKADTRAGRLFTPSVGGSVMDGYGGGAAGTNIPNYWGNR